jgi:hypothetical protein
MIEHSVGAVITFNTGSLESSYQLLECVGRKYGATVYKAQDMWIQGDDGICLLKLLPCNDLSGSDDYKALVAHVGDILDLRHHNVCRSSCIFDMDGGLCLKRVFVEGKSVARRMSVRQDTRSA